MLTGDMDHGEKKTGTMTGEKVGDWQSLEVSCSGLANNAMQAWFISFFCSKSKGSAHRVAPVLQQTCVILSGLLQIIRDKERGGWASWRNSTTRAGRRRAQDDNQQLSEALAQLENNVWHQLQLMRGKLGSGSSALKPSLAE